PYGNPIPGLEELGGPPAGEFLSGVISLRELTADDEGEHEVVIRRLAEPVQFEPATLQLLQDGGIVPGAGATVARTDEGVRVQVGDAEPTALPAELTGHIYVATLTSV